MLVSQGSLEALMRNKWTKCAVFMIPHRTLEVGAVRVSRPDSNLVPLPASTESSQDPPLLSLTRTWPLTEDVALYQAINQWPLQQ